MPPSAFDGMPAVATITNSGIVLTSPVDPHYGLRAIRNILLVDNSLYIKTTYERVSGEPSKIGIWTIAQFKEPSGVFVPVKTSSIFANGYFKFGTEPWPQLQHRGRYLEITRDVRTAHKMGSDEDRLLWVGEDSACLVRSKRIADSEYPDRGASTEVYTNPDPKRYVELEMLGPLSLMKPGDKISFETTYAIYYRRKVSAAEELPWLGMQR
jgi:hypothetical protein